jgi:hypothetical protein
VKFGRIHSTAKLIDFPTLVNKNLRLRIRNLPDPLPPDWSAAASRSRLTRMAGRATISGRYRKLSRRR